MKRDHTGAVRAFSILSQAWYGAANLRSADYTDQISIGMYHLEGGTSGEFTVQWIPLLGRPFAQLQVFDDAWDALHQFQDVLAKMAERDKENITPEEFAELLLSCGVVDQTKRTQ